MKYNLIKSLFNKHIKPHLNKNELQYKSGLLFNIHNGLLKGYCFNGSSFSRTQFEIVVFVLPLYVPSDFVGLSFGYFLRSPQKRQWWEYDEMKLEELGKHLAIVINEADKKFLSKINTAADFYHFYKRNNTNSTRFYEAVAYSATYAKIDGYKKLLDNFISFLEKSEDFKFDWAKEIYKNTKLLLEDGGEEYLKKWEVVTRGNLGLIPSSPSL